MRAGAAALAAALLCVPALAPSQAAADPVLPTSGGVLYVTNAGSCDVSSLAIGPGGVLKPLTKTPVRTGGETPRGIALTLNGATAYVVNSDSDTLSVFRVGAQGALQEKPQVLPTGDELG
jgi:DNA-binding beta-propeller fold protein YncE